MIDKEWLAGVFIKHYGFVLSLSFSYAPLPEDAREVAQQVYLELLDEEKTWDDVDDLKKHLRTLTRRVARRYWYERQHQQDDIRYRIGLYLSAITEANEKHRDYDDELHRLKHCLDALPKKSRDVVENYYFNDQSIAAIGQRLGKTVDAVYKAIHRIRTKLRNCIAAGTNRRTDHV